MNTQQNKWIKKLRSVRTPAQDLEGKIQEKVLSDSRYIFVKINMAPNSSTLKKKKIDSCVICTR